MPRLISSLSLITLSDMLFTSRTFLINSPISKWLLLHLSSHPKHDNSLYAAPRLQAFPPFHLVSWTYSISTFLLCIKSDNSLAISIITPAFSNKQYLLVQLRSYPLSQTYSKNWVCLAFIPMKPFCAFHNFLSLLKLLILICNTQFTFLLSFLLVTKCVNLQYTHHLYNQMCLLVIAW